MSPANGTSGNDASFPGRRHDERDSARRLGLPPPSLQTGGTSTGHLVLMEQPERVVDMTVAWWKYMLNGDEDAKKDVHGRQLRSL